MRIFFVILFFSFSIYPVKCQKSSEINNDFLTYKERKVSLKDIRFQNFQFDFDRNILTDSVTVHWYEAKKSLYKKFPGFELLNPGLELADSIYYIPSASRFSGALFQNIEFNSDSLFFKIGEINGEILSKMFLPFYFKNVEVTNKEYREFVSYVRDSIARRLLAEVFPDEYLKTKKESGDDTPDEAYLLLNWDKEFKYNDPELKPILNKMYNPDNIKFYWHREFDVSKFIYKYYEYDPYYYAEVPGHEKAPGNMIPHSISVYPDTTVWNKNFPFPSMDPLARNYFWHEAYDDYPVVGITWEQAKAFCIWKTEQLNKKLIREKFPFLVTVNLPKEEEWEYVISKYLDHSNIEKQRLYQIQEYPEFFSYFKMVDQDLDWKTNLVFQWPDMFYQEIKRDTLKQPGGWIYNTNYSMVDLIVSDNTLKGYFEAATTGNFLVKYAKKKSDSYKVNYESMAFNASEWMDQDYKGSYAYYWSVRTAAMITDSVQNHQKAFSNEINNYTDNANSIGISQHGKLVRGSNWFDQGSPDYLNFELKYAHKKAFVPKDSAYSTLGFRYVIYLKPKH